MNVAGIPEAHDPKGFGSSAQYWSRSRVVPGVGDDEKEGSDMTPVFIMVACLLAFLVGSPLQAQDMDLTNPEMADFDGEGQAADLGNYMADRAVIDDEGQAADLGNDSVDRAVIDDEGQGADLEPY
jgi:hypothetical protein